MFESSTSFAYVHADGVTYDGPVTVFGNGANEDNSSEVALTNINGSFVVTPFGSMGSGLATEIAASGCQ
jgi:putative transposon-encoded protein